MNFKEYTDTINMIQRKLLSRMAEVHTYKKWDNEFSRKQIDESILWLRAYISLSASDRVGDICDFEEMKKGRWYNDEKLSSFVKPSNLLPLPNSILGDQTDLAASMLFEIGFGNWDGKGLYLIPLWLVPFINPDVEVESIDGTKCQLRDADNDNRGGLIAYGFRALLPIPE